MVRLFFVICSRLLVLILAGGFPLFPVPPGSRPVAVPPAGSDVREKINEVRRSLDRIKPFKVDFVQQVIAGDDRGTGQADLEESGEILFKNGRQLKWTYLEPDYKVFLLEGDDYRFYDEDNEQLIIGKIKDRSRQWIWQTLFSDDIFRFARWDEARKRIHIENDRDSIDIEITVNAGFLPGKVVQTDLSGARTVCYFKNYRPKIAIPGDAFLLKVPEGVDIIRQNEVEIEK